MSFTAAYVAIAKPSAKDPDLQASGYAAATMIYIYAVGYCFSWAAIPWIYANEIFPTRIRGLAMAICTAVHWLMNFMIARSVPYMISNIGYGIYLVFAACLTLAVPFIYFLVPETKGRSLEDIGAVFEKSRTQTMEDRDVEKESVMQVEVV
jgi:hypothetical protein